MAVQGQPNFIKYKTMKKKGDIPTHHILKCKVCKKESKESLRYHYACSTCRLNTNYYRKCTEGWTAWGG